ncbi:cytochrome c-type biogenesis protein CcmE [Litoribrevibacter albus]|uniref:Cytochrome c-type biogenesis protein CcmE n=2 Tax=Litoribrevibacter albus TaxID=1473156 RepID=A0AA37SCT6_9GAMM|nr:cytochrome c-type biogenesis protein CcmE [Litoribrevibacter albus]
MAMHPKRKKRLIAVCMIVLAAGAAIGLILYALSSNINLFFSPTDIADGKAPVEQRIRAGGMVLEGSVKRGEKLDVQFVLTDYANNVTVQYNGILPDLFREGQGIVATGKLDANRVFIASEVLAKHDENYMPPEVAEALEKSGHKVKSDSEKPAQY